MNDAAFILTITAIFVAGLFIVLCLLSLIYPPEPTRPSGRTVRPRLVNNELHVGGHLFQISASQNRYICRWCQANCRCDQLAQRLKNGTITAHCPQDWNRP